MVVSLTKGSTPVELVKQNKRTVWVKVENTVVTKDDKGEEVRTTSFKTIKRKLRDVVAQ